MGNDIEIDKKKETIIWIDSNVFNSENTITYKNCLPIFINFNFIRFSSVEKAIDCIKDKKTKNFLNLDCYMQLLVDHWQKNFLIYMYKYPKKEILS